MQERIYFETNLSAKNVSKIIMIHKYKINVNSHEKIKSKKNATLYKNLLKD